MRRRNVSAIFILTFLEIYAIVMSCLPQRGSISSSPEVKFNVLAYIIELATIVIQREKKGSVQA